VPHRGARAIILPMSYGKPRFLQWFAGYGPAGPPGYLLPRWLFLRALGFIYFSAFYSLAFQIRGLLGPNGLLPAGMYLEQVGEMAGRARYWYAPTLLWLGSSDRALMVLCWAGMIASLLLMLNLWPRGMLAICFVLFLSFVSAAQEFSGYQSDGMLLAAGFVSFFFAPGGLRPGWGEAKRPSRISLWLLRLLWFSIYFESGVAKYFGGDPSWRDLTAMDQYYQNGPLPTWIGWYAQQLPQKFHAATALLTLAVELALVWAVFLPRRFRIACFFIVTALQIGITLTANYAFLNYLVLSLGFLLLDDRFLTRFLPPRWATAVRQNLRHLPPVEALKQTVELDLHSPVPDETRELPESSAASTVSPGPFSFLRDLAESVGLWVSAILLAWILYADLSLILTRVSPGILLPEQPVTMLEPFRIADHYGLFGRMTWKRYEIEFQGSNDGTTWITYPFRNKPQDPAQAPRIYAPYQPRFDWNMWFASLGYWRDNPWVLRAEQRLLANEPNVVALFAANPFAQAPPKQVRAVLWEYWMTDLATKRATHMWWRREYRGLYAPSLEEGTGGKVIVTAWPDAAPPLP
jgi:lipase maturation factor 1